MKNTEVVKASYNKHIELFNDIYTSIIPFPSAIVVEDKYYAKKFLQSHGLLVAPGEIFTEETIKQALEFGEKIEYPVVLKPTVGSHGNHVFLDIQNKKELEKKIRHFCKNKYGNGFYLVEKEYKGNEFRLFITQKGFFACVSRIPANVIGNGIDTIRALVDKENYRRMNPRNTCLCEIHFDEISQDFFEKYNIDISYIPKLGEVVSLRQNSNVSTGGNCYEITNTVHPSIVSLAKSVLSKFNDLPFIGIDLICEDITKPLKEYVICELDCTPGLSMHMMPEKGEPQNVAKEIVDVIFPETMYV
jgi:cyanophycin synthetase